ncbi:hypothetical protein ACH5RR_022829 [Cinchona calisaya]|uniref:3'-5' exonuclease domain-containing protein n=1 Tax=Cinchona calisaya TaxID=153742 RepID=A0ABD2ZCU7_9GENT
MTTSASNISNSSKYFVYFDGKTIETTVTNKAEIVNQWVQLILLKCAGKPTVVGLDNEWRPHPVPYMSNKSATLQLCIDDNCLIVDKDIMKLKDEYGLKCTKSADIREVAKMRWPGRFSRPGLKDLAREVSGLYMKKPLHVTKSQWDARVLSADQVEYACIDAYASYKIGNMLLLN